MAGARTKWYVVNIKARTDQTPQHYYDALKRLKEVNNPIKITGDKYVLIGSITNDTIINPTTGIPDWIVIKLMSFIVVDPNGFYDKRAMQPVSINWNDDWVGNRKEDEVLFCFANHTLAIKKSSKITLNHVVKYFKEALNTLDPNSFDVDIIADKGVIDRIKNAYSVIRIDANISYSNPGHASRFPGVFDYELKEANPITFQATLIGNQDNPLGNKPGGFVDALVGAAERDGTVKAKIKENANSEVISIDTGQHPRIVEVKGEKGSNLANVWEKIRSLFQ